MIMLDTAVTNTTTLLVYDDLEAVHEYLVRVFGLTAGPLTRDDRGAVVHGEVRADSQVIWLHPAAGGYRFPRSLGAVTSMTVITVDDTDAHHARSVAAGAAIVSPPVGRPYGSAGTAPGTRRAGSGTFTRRWRSTAPVSATRSPCHPHAAPVVLTRDVVVSTKIPRLTGGSSARSRPRV